MEGRSEELDETALEKLYCRLEKPLYNVVYRSLWDTAESRDLVHEAFLRLWQMRRRVRMAAVEPLVYRIALNLVSKRQRTARTWRWVPLAALARRKAPRADATARLLEHERAREVRAALDGLPEDLRRVVVLTELTSLTYDEIAGVLSIPAGTVGSRRHRALARLRERLTQPAAAGPSAPAHEGTT